MRWQQRRGAYRRGSPKPLQAVCFVRTRRMCARRPLAPRRRPLTFFWRSHTPTGHRESLLFHRLQRLAVEDTGGRAVGCGLTSANAPAPLGQQSPPLHRATTRLPITGDRPSNASLGSCIADGAPWENDADRLQQPNPTSSQRLARHPPPRREFSG